ncbi:uncharacterized protein LOC135367296 isoform X2 [Ornithodoros turicata]|uniref:uncharacterized protein LOC135367296 isoform X2 n=1 Tax=Ornithodoros turicata TaxID=34597 RepID=UPI003138986A
MAPRISLLLVASLCSVLDDQGRIFASQWDNLWYEPPPKVPLKPYAETKSILSKYQDAWKFITRNRTMFLYQRSYKHDRMYGKNGQCVKAEVIYIDRRTKTATVQLSSANHKKREITQFVAYFTANRTRGYDVYNVLYARYELDSDDPGYHYPMIFSDYKTCGILRIPHYEKRIVQKEVHPVATLMVCPGMGVVYGTKQSNIQEMRDVREQND